MQASTGSCIGQSGRSVHLYDPSHYPRKAPLSLNLQIPSHKNILVGQSNSFSTSPIRTSVVVRSNKVLECKGNSDKTSRSSNECRRFNVRLGSTLGSVKAAGFWNRRVTYQSSNYRELLAILLALYSYKDRIQNKCIQILSDNISAIAYINRLGGSSKPLSQLATAIWHFAYENGIYLVARHISGHRNIQADYYSRLLPLRMASSSSPFLSFGPSVGPSRHRSFCLYDQHPIASIQQSFCRSSVIRDRCFKPTKLGIYEQLCKSTISYDSTSTTENSASQSISNCDRPKMARTNMVSAITTHVHS